MYHKMRIRAALVGIESFSEEGLKSANKLWNPAGRKMVETIERIQDAGIVVLSSIICGLEPDTVHTIRTMREFALESGSILAQFHHLPSLPRNQRLLRNDQRLTRAAQNRVLFPSIRVNFGRSDSG